MISVLFLNKNTEKSWVFMRAKDCELLAIHLDLAVSYHLLWFLIWLFPLLWLYWLCFNCIRCALRVETLNCIKLLRFSTRKACPWWKTLPYHDISRHIRIDVLIALLFEHVIVYLMNRVLVFAGLVCSWNRGGNFSGIKGLLLDV